jgi:hypothetical protein
VFKTAMLYIQWLFYSIDKNTVQGRDRQKRKGKQNNFSIYFFVAKAVAKAKNNS